MGVLDTLAKTLATEESAKTSQKKKKSGQKELAKQLTKQLAELERQEGALAERKKQLKQKEKEFESKLQEIEKTQKKEIEKLEKIAKLSHQEAKKLLLEATEKKLTEQLAKKIKETEEEIKSRSDELAREILVEAMRHGATEYVAEYTVSTVQLPDEDIKGRIIGREGRNIRAFERATGVEIELDEANSLHLSSFDPVRREIAKRALKKLISDRRIQPARIKEVVEKTKKEVEKIMFEEGQKLCHALKVYRLQRGLIELLGRFKFRFSYGQNMIAHTLEETKIGVAVANEVGADVNIVRLGCLLHDIGKVITDKEGTHVQLGVELLKKYQLPKEVIACVAEHHEDQPFSSIESQIVWLADAISGARPGARYEPHEEYLKRMTQIEETVKKFDEVKEVFAYQAGRLVSVLVRPDKISDDELTVLAHKISRKLEDEVSYAGQIKVVCIRETQASETTKAK